MVYTGCQDILYTPHWVGGVGDPEGARRATGGEQLVSLVTVGLKSLCENSFLLSFRGAEGDEESRSVIENIQSEIPRFARNDTLN